MVRLLTGWVLTKGPCGPNCTELDIGRSTNNSRFEVMTTYNNSVFGDWALEFDCHNGTKGDPVITNRVNSAIEERVQAVNEHFAWELDASEILINLDTPCDSDVVCVDLVFIMHCNNRLITQAFSCHIKEKILCRYNDIYVVKTTYYVVITTYDGCRYNKILWKFISWKVYFLQHCITIPFSTDTKIDVMIL